MVLNFHLVQNNNEINKLMLQNFSGFFVIVFYSPSQHSNIIQKIEQLSSFQPEIYFLLVNRDENNESVEVFEPLDGLSSVFSDSMKNIQLRIKIDQFTDFVENIETEFEEFQRVFAQKKEEMFNLLDKLFNEQFENIHIFIKGTPTHMRCKFTRQLNTLLEPYQFQYSYFDILENQDVRNWNRLYSGWNTYPQLWINKKFIGGLDTIKSLMENNQFESLIPKTNETKQQKQDRILKKFEVLLVTDPSQTKIQSEDVLMYNGIQYFKYVNRDQIFQGEMPQLYLQQKQIQFPKDKNEAWSIIPAQNLKLETNQKFEFLFMQHPYVCFLEGNIHDQQLDLNKVQIFNVLADESLKKYIEKISNSQNYPQIFKNQEFVGNDVQQI